MSTGRFYTDNLSKKEYVEQNLANRSDTLRDNGVNISLKHIEKVLLENGADKLFYVRG